ncbi:MAG: hypothetical protein UZ17_ACD001001455 [Acidobacteria bacterium OLB17]|nr:MAG: hypothetical protein UZ17_ACD001001455 [Acidobacteria bacterium OLB17]MCZ2391265.1 hypothetical protein [Acidobacteriota bacterium]
MVKQTLNFLSVAVIILAAATLSFGQSDGLKRTTTKTDRFDFGPGGTITIKGAPNGSVKVVGSRTNEISISAVIEVSGGTEVEMQQVTNLSGFVVQESLSHITIFSIGPDDRKAAKKADRKLLKKLAQIPYSISYTISVPQYSDVEVNAGKGDISIAGIDGDLRVNGIESDLDVALLSGTLSAIVNKGSVTFTMPDQAWRGSLIDVQVANGTLTAHLPRALSADLTATVLRTGTITNELTFLKPRIRNVPFTDRAVAARAGNGGTAVKLTVGDGKLSLLPL